MADANNGDNDIVQADDNSNANDAVQAADNSNTNDVDEGEKDLVGAQGAQQPQKKKKEKKSDCSSSSLGGLCGRFKLDLFSVEREEARTRFLHACSTLDVKTVWDSIDNQCAHTVNPSKAVDCIGQNCYHFLVTAARADEIGERIDDRQEQILSWVWQFADLDLNKRRTTDGWTPLMLAAVFNRTPMLKKLLLVGADFTVKDNNGLTAEDLATQYKMEKARHMIFQ